MKRIPYILLIIITLVGLSSSTTSTTQMPDTRAIVKALYIYTFATLVEWPKDKRNGDFVIGVFGEKTAVYKELSIKYSGKSIGSQKIIIKNYTDKNKIGDCHILYVTAINTRYMSELSERMDSKNTLLVGEKNGALSKGAIVNFIVEGSQQKYEINKINANNHKLVIAEKLSTLAARVIK